MLKRFIDNWQSSSAALANWPLSYEQLRYSKTDLQPLIRGVLGLGQSTQGVDKYNPGQKATKEPSKLKRLGKDNGRTDLSEKGLH